MTYLPFSTKAADYIQEFCVPLQKIGLTNFMHDITFGKGQISMLVSNENVFKYYYENKIPMLCTDDSGRTLAAGTYLDTVLQNTHKDCAVLMPLLPKVGKQYDLNYGRHSIHVVERENDCQHLYSLFFDLEEKQFLHWVVNNGKFLNDLIAEYNYVANDVILEAKSLENRIELPNFNPELHNTSKEHGLTSRQASCLYYLARGMTMKEIAKISQLSPRTVEHYLEAVKTKLKCSTRSELIEKALQLKLLK